jgi:hypothetical protein
MDKSMLAQHLRLAERHCIEGERILARQRSRVGELRQDRHDTSAAEALLQEFEETQALHLAECDKLRSELGIDPPTDA